MGLCACKGTGKWNEDPYPQEVEELIKEWEPEPLVPHEMSDLEKLNLERTPVIVG